VRVSYLEGVTMERALEALKIPHRFLVFPGEGHGLPKNPCMGISSEGRAEVVGYLCPEVKLHGLGLWFSSIEL